MKPTPEQVEAAKAYARAWPGTMYEPSKAAMMTLLAALEESEKRVQIYQEAESNYQAVTQNIRKEAEARIDSLEGRLDYYERGT